jgi:hypothetical protein
MPVWHGHTSSSVFQCLVTPRVLSCTWTASLTQLSAESGQSPESVPQMSMLPCLPTGFPPFVSEDRLAALPGPDPYLEVQHTTTWLHGNCTDSLQNEDLKPCEWWCPHSTIPSGLSTQFANQPASKLEVSKLQHHDDLLNKHQKTLLLYSCQYSRSKPYLDSRKFSWGKPLWTPNQSTRIKMKGCGE